MKVLIIDDDLLFREVIIQMLETQPGFEFEEANGGPEALKILEERVPDVVLCDLIMPEMSGNEVIQAISKMHPLLPIIALSGTKSVETATNALRNGAWDYVTKPIQNIQDLIQPVHSCFQTAQVKSENATLRYLMSKLLSNEALMGGTEQHLLEAFPCGSCSLQLTGERVEVIYQNSVVCELLEAFGSLSDNVQIEDILDLKENSADSQIIEILSYKLKNNQTFRGKSASRIGEFGLTLVPAKTSESTPRGILLIETP